MEYIYRCNSQFNLLTLMEKIEVAFKVTLDDVKEFQFYHYKKSISYKFFIVCCIFFVPLTLLIFFADPKQNWLLGCLGFIYLFLLIFWIPMRIKRRSRLNFTTTKAYEDEINWTIDEIGFVVKGTNFEGKNQWTSLYKVKELKNIFVFYSNKFAATILPKRALTERNMAELKKFFNLKSPK